MYSLGVSEEVTGRALNELARREEVILATKVFNPMGDTPNERGLSRKHIMHGIDASLKRLGTDYVDLYQIHRFDTSVPVEVTMEALHDVVKAGKALHVGASSMWAWQLAKMQHVAERNGWTKFATMQNVYNLVYREEEREMLPLCVDQGLGVIPWSPLARGFLARSGGVESEQETTRGRTDEFSRMLRIGKENDLEIRAVVTEIAQARGVANAQVALAWLLSKPAVTAPIVGASKMAHLEDALAALEIELDDEEIERLEAPYLPHRVAGHR
jgi:aryl-alcohol dehydrogenase-like predicted oxidoreductase